MTVLVPLLHTCLHATLSLQYYPKAWWTWTTVVLRKPGKADYMVAKVYCPVALYNTMGKTVLAVMTDMLVYLTVWHNFLPAKCFRGLPGHTTTDSLLYLINNIMNAWRQQQVATAKPLLSFWTLPALSQIPSQLGCWALANMVRLGYPTQLVHFFKAMLSDRHTALSFDGHTSETFEVDNGIGQGEPSSMILYLIYSHALMGIPPTCGGDGSAYMVDNFFTAFGNTLKECDEKINQMLDKQDVWSAAHNSHAGVSASLDALICHGQTFTKWALALVLP